MDTNCKLIATYENPDLDGYACAYGYSEFLNKNNEKSKFVLFGNYQIEVEYLLQKYNIPSVSEEVNSLELGQHPVIIVDASDLRGLSKRINPSNVIEIIDHRKVYKKEDFPNASFQIELVGAAATLIAEKYKISNTDISFDVAVLLYYAIVSNTINFKANVTTAKDLEISNWLNQIIKQKPIVINEMFDYKTRNIIPSKEFFLGSYSAFFKFKDISIGIIQLEITNALNFLHSNKNKLTSILKEVKRESNLDIIFITAIDLVEGNNYFFTQYTKSRKILTDALLVSFSMGIALRKGVIMRKEIVPILKGFIEM